MATFRAKAVNPKDGRSVDCNILLDSGCSYSHLDGALSRKLGLKPAKKLTIATSTFHTESRRKVTTDLVSFDLVRRPSLAHLSPRYRSAGRADLHARRQPA